MAREQQAAFDVGPRAGARTGDEEEVGETTLENGLVYWIPNRSNYLSFVHQWVRSQTSFWKSALIASHYTSQRARPGVRRRTPTRSRQTAERGGCGVALRGLAAFRRRWLRGGSPQSQIGACEVLTEAGARGLVRQHRGRRESPPAQWVGACGRARTPRTLSVAARQVASTGTLTPTRRSGADGKAPSDVACGSSDTPVRPACPDPRHHARSRGRTAVYAPHWAGSRTTAPRAERPWTRSRMSVIDVVNVVTCAANMADGDFDERERRKSSHRKWKQKLP